MMKLDRLCEKYGVSISCKETGDPGSWEGPRGSMHWKVVLRMEGRQLTTAFHQGPAICKEPTAADVVSCLASDWSGIQSTRDFEDWATDYGYDTDSRKAEKLYQACKRAAEKFARWAGDRADEFVSAEW